MGGACRTYVGGGEVYKSFFWGGRNLRGKTALERRRGRLENNIKMDLQVIGWSAWAGLMWLRIGTGSGLL